MCGRFDFSAEGDIDEIARIIQTIDKETAGAPFKTGEIYPTNTVPVLVGEKAHPVLMDWGIPKWDGKGVIINARSETAGEKKTFARALRERRCVIACSGFYEWQRKTAEKGGKKDKFLFRSDEGKVLYMAGIFHETEVDGSLIRKFVILTRDANVSIADIHDRMPVILRRNELTSWITDDHFKDFLFQRDDIVLRRQAT